MMVHSPGSTARQRDARSAFQQRLLRGQTAGLALRLADLGQQIALRNYGLFLRSAEAGLGLLDDLSPHAAWRAAEQARLRVPAYRMLLERTGWSDRPGLPPAERLRRLPVTDKTTYVKAFSTEDRCLDGRIPLVGTQIDESSGASGTPFNWVRSAAELRDVHRLMHQFTRYYCGTGVITINGFSMGAWATGVNVGEAMRFNGMVKSTGPDIDKILYTLEFFGPRYRYVLTGYPPFLKHLVDEGRTRGFDWRAYRITGMVGGEGMTEGLRTYLERSFDAVYSGYGASDLDIGIAAEFPITVWVRKRTAADRRLHAALFGDDPRLPMLFQYNPLEHYIEINEQGELIFTINRLGVLSPRIRYNIHDSGGVIAFDRVLAVLREFGLDPVAACRRPGQPVFRLPFLYLFGRSDSTLSYMGANIYPEDIEEALFGDADDERQLGAYCLELVDVGAGEQRPCVHVEVHEAAAVDQGELAERLRRRILDRLQQSNRDFRAAIAEDASAGELLVRLHSAGQGPFVGNRTRIKRRYIVPFTSPGPFVEGR